MFRPFRAGNVMTDEAPTGHNLIAQGNALEIIAHGIAPGTITQGIALGMRHIKSSSPERATPFAGLPTVAYVLPLQGGGSFLPCSQGVALGLRPIKPPSPERATSFAGLLTVAYVPPLQGGECDD